MNDEKALILITTLLFFYSAFATLKWLNWKAEAKSHERLFTYQETVLLDKFKREEI